MVRITCDLDSTSTLTLANSLLRGIFLLRRLPDTIRQTSKGFHVIYYGINATEDRSYKLRWIIGDDPNRISLDLKSPLRISQVLFSEKIVKYFDVPKDFRCPVCKEKNIEMNIKHWTFDKKLFEVRHRNGKVCVTKLKCFRPPLFLKVLEKMGLTNVRKE